MARFIGLALLVLLVVISGCGGTAIDTPNGSPSIEGVPQAISHGDTAIQRSSATATAGMLRLLSPDGFIHGGSLPAIPGDRGRIPSAVTTDTLNGTDTYDRSTNTVDNDPQLVLYTAGDQSSWAIYRIEGVTTDTTIQQVVVNTSNPNFTGDHPGYWVGLANYTEQRWEALALTESSSFTHGITSSADYRSPADNMYIYVLVHGGQGLAIDSVAVTLDRPGEPPEITFVTPDTGTTGAEVTFSVTTTGGTPTSWDWDFGGGATPDTSTAESPVVTLGAPGDYSASIGVANDSGSDSFEFTLHISDGPAQWLQATISVSDSCGWTPAMVFTTSGNPLVVFGDLTDGIPRMAIGDASTDLTDQANWSIGEIDPAPIGIAAFLDVVLDPASGFPRVSMNYIGIDGGDEDSVTSFSAFENSTEGPVWLTYDLGWTDGGHYTNIDFDPVTGFYGLVSGAQNSNHPGEEGYPANDMHYWILEYNPAAPETLPNNKIYNFGENWRFPHLRYQGLAGATVAVNGGFVLQDALPQWVTLYDNSESTSLGSLAVHPDNGNLGSAYATAGSAGQALTYVGFDASQVGTAEVVDSIPDTSSNEHIGISNQVAFSPAGTPAIAYTQSDGTQIYVKFATLAGESWVIEDVSPTPNTPTTETLVYLDLAFDQSGNPGVCYTRLEGDSAWLRVALRNGG